MVSPAVGKVVLVPFPFSDLSQSKLRPAVIVAHAGRADWVLCQVTSNPYGDPSSISVTNESFATGSLRIASFARPGKVFTADLGLMIGEVGLLKGDVTRRIIRSIIEVFESGMPSETGQG